MPVTITSTAFIYDTGELRPEWFPNEDLHASTTKWIAQESARVPAGATDDQANAVVEAAVYVRAYDAKAKAVAGTPDSISVEDISRTTSNGRVNFWVEQRDEWQAKLDARVLAATPAPAPAVAPQPRYSRSTPIVRSSF